MSDIVTNFKVKDKKSFIEFLEVLKEDFETNPESWENKKLPDFLDALSSYTQDIQGYYDNMDLNVNSEMPTWELFADIFKGAKIYE